MLIVMCSAVTRNKRKERKVEGTPQNEEVDPDAYKSVYFLHQQEKERITQQQTKEKPVPPVAADGKAAIEEREREGEPHAGMYCF